MHLIQKFNQIKIFYKGDLISDEPLIRDYAKFLFQSLDQDQAILALHTGSKCFDIISILVTFLKVAEKELNHEPDFTNFKEGDIVLYRTLDGQIKRERWIGIGDDDGVKSIFTREDDSKKDGGVENSRPYEIYKNRITLYNGASNTTGSSGISQKNKVSNKFLEYIFDKGPNEIPQILHTIEIITDNNYFEDIISNTTIEYGKGQKVNLCDLAPASYETSNGNLKQFGTNSAKLTPVFVYTEKITTARDRMFQNSDNGLPFTILILKDVENSDTLTDIDVFIDPNNDMISQVIFSTRTRSKVSKYLLNSDSGFSIFACTPEFMNNYKNLPIANKNTLTRELNHQIKHASSKHPVETIDIPGGISKDDYRTLRQKSRNEDLPEELKEQFKIAVFTLLKLLNTMCFSTEELEDNLKNTERSSIVKTPDACLKDLISINQSAPTPTGDFVIEKMHHFVNKIKTQNPKQSKLLELLQRYRTASQILVIVEKAYYRDILAKTLSSYPNVNIITPSEIHKQNTNIDLIVVTSSLANEKNDVFYLASSAKVVVLLYENEKSLYHHQKIYHDSYAKKLSLRLNHVSTSSPEFKSEVQKETESKKFIDENLISITREINSYNNQNGIKRLQNSNPDGASGGYECSYIAALSEGYKIVFSDYYAAAVYDDQEKVVVEKTPDQIQVGDKIIFVKNNDLKRNIIDYIFHSLYEKKLFAEDFVEQYQLSLVWRNLLRSFMDVNNMNVSKLFLYFSANASREFNYQTMLSWVKNPNLIGPKYPETLKIIGEAIGSQELATNYDKHYEAIRAVRNQRRKIIDLIGRVIKNDFAEQPAEDEDEDTEIFKLIRDNVNKLSDILEVEQIEKLDHPQEFNINFVNKPICIES